MSVESLVALLEAKRYAECREAADRLVRESELTATERSQACLALSFSLSALQDLQEALAPGELAVYFGREAGEYDLLGRSLCHLAGLYHENRLEKRAVGCLEEYFRHFTLYSDQARGLEGWALSQLALCYQAMGRHAKSLEYFRKAYRWYGRESSPLPVLDQHRGELAWQALKMGDVEEARPLLADSACYLRQAPNDLEARARYWNNVAYLHYLTGNYTTAVEHAVSVIHIRGVSALRRGQACLTLHYAAKAMGRLKEAMGLGTLTRIQANLCRRPDLEEEATRSMLHMQQEGGLPLVDELLRSVTEWSRRAVPS